MTHQFDVLAGQKGADLSRCVRARIVIVNNDSSSLVRFLKFSEDFRQTNCGILLRIDAQVEQSPHDQFCRRNGRPSASHGFFHEQLSFDLARIRRPTRWTVVRIHP